MDQQIFKNLIVFCILMENNEGILGKSPAYIKEKYRVTNWGPGSEGLLDSSSLTKFQAYMRKWKPYED